MVFFITYVLFQPPATVLCRKIGPRVFLTTITVSWGIVMVSNAILCLSPLLVSPNVNNFQICFGFPQAWTSFIPLRIILGLLEAGFFPACTYLVSTWYTRFDVQKRYAGFYMLGIVSSAFSGILAFGFSQMVCSSMCH